MNLNDLLEIMIHAVLAIFGVSARELRYKDERQIKLARLVSNAFVSTFGATIVFLIISMSNLPHQLGYIMAGLVGWGGPQVIDKLFEKHVGIKVDAERTNTDEKPEEMSDNDPGDESQTR